MPCAYGARSAVKPCGRSARTFMGAYELPGAGHVRGTDYHPVTGHWLRYLHTDTVSQWPFLLYPDITASYQIRGTSAD
jgi:hypothetical protein